jgi:hypothetical protein
MHAEIVYLDCAEISAEALVSNDDGKIVWKSHFMRTRRLIGTPDMKATSFLLDETRTPIAIPYAILGVSTPWRVRRRSNDDDTS